MKLKHLYIYNTLLTLFIYLLVGVLRPTGECFTRTTPTNITVRGDRGEPTIGLLCSLINCFNTSL